MLLSLCTFSSSLPKSLLKEKGTSNTSISPQCPRAHWSDYRCIWLGSQRGKKWICRHAISGIFRQQETKIHQRWEGESFVLSVSGPNNAINRAEQKRRRLVCQRWAKFDAQQGLDMKRGEAHLRSLDATPIETLLKGSNLIYVFNV